jgi:hypothetical protein
VKFFSKKRQPTETEVSEPTDPVLPCGVEKLETAEGELLLDNARIIHMVNGRAIRGYVVDPATGKTTDELKLVPMSIVGRHVAMGWRNSDRSLHEINVTPYSLTL